MGLRLELVPLTECDARELGADASRVYVTNARRLDADFPNLRNSYSSPTQAADTIRRRQEGMLAEPGFVVHAVMLGWTAEAEGEADLEVRFAGMASHNPSEVPEVNGTTDTDEPGVHFASWLDMHRPQQLKGVGVPLMRARIDSLAADPGSVGRPWTLILPSNHASLKVWEHAGYRGGGYEKTGTPDLYPSVLDDGKRRQLFIARFTLEQLRV